MPIHIKAYLQLARPANLPTAAADIMAGAAIAGFFHDMGFSDFGPDFLWLIAASICLYAGGVVMNDVFDVDIDREERPERPIPSGKVSLAAAKRYGMGLLLLGLALAFLTSPISGGLALVLAVAILLYDGYAKKFAFLGPMNMGICRGLNLLLGMSILGMPKLGSMALVPVVYIFAITLISRGEVHGNNRRNILLAGGLYLAVLLTLGGVSQFFARTDVISWVFLAGFALMILVPLIQAYQKNTPTNIKKAVKMGILALIVMDATITALFSNWKDALLVLALLPLSMALSKLFAVT
ncbi:MAG: UbiA-like protein EboC [Flavobacteriaceae bacterium]